MNTLGVYALLLAGSCLVLASAKPPRASKAPGVRYANVRSKVLGTLGRGLKVVVDGRTTVLVPAGGEDAFLAVSAVQDFDGDGTLDALVQRTGGGNGGGEQFFFVQNIGNRTFRITKDFDAFGTTNLVGVKPLAKGWCVDVTANGEGWNTDPPRYKTARWVLREGEAVMVEENVLKEMPAPLEFRSSQLVQKGSMVATDFCVDLDEDGRPEQVHCEPWERWGRMRVTLTLGNGSTFTFEDCVKRIGFLDTRHEAFRDVVLDFDEVYHWDGSGYVKVSGTTPWDQGGKGEGQGD